MCDGHLLKATAADRSDVAKRSQSHYVIGPQAQGDLDQWLFSALVFEGIL